jgi:hypothetical protein
VSGCLSNPLLDLLFSSKRATVAFHEPAMSVVFYQVVEQSFLLSLIYFTFSKSHPDVRMLLQRLYLQTSLNTPT